MNQIIFETVYKKKSYNKGIGYLTFKQTNSMVASRPLVKFLLSTLCKTIRKAITTHTFALDSSMSTSKFEVSDGLLTSGM